MAGPYALHRPSYVFYKFLLRTVHLSKTKLPFFISRRTDFRPGFPHSRAQDVSTHVRDVHGTQKTNIAEDGLGSQSQPDQLFQWDFHPRLLLAPQGPPMSTGWRFWYRLLGFYHIVLVQGYW